MKLMAILLALLMTVPFCSASNISMLTVANIVRDTIIQCPDVGRAAVIVDSAHMGITIELNPYANNADIALASAIGAYQGVLKTTDYNGYLRVAFYKRGQIRSIYEVPAFRVLEALEKLGRATSKEEEMKVDIQLYNDVVNNGKYITYSYNDAFGDITKTIETEGGRLSPSVGNWLG